MPISTWIFFFSPKFSSDHLWTIAEPLLARDGRHGITMSMSDPWNCNDHLWTALVFQYRFLFLNFCFSVLEFRDQRYNGRNYGEDMGAQQFTQSTMLLMVTQASYRLIFCRKILGIIRHANNEIDYFFTEISLKKTLLTENWQWCSVIFCICNYFGVYYRSQLFSAVLAKNAQIFLVHHSSTHYIHHFLLFFNIFKNGRKIIHSNGAFFHPMIADCVHVFNRCCFHVYRKNTLESWKFSSGQVECSFDNLAEIFFTKSPKNFRSKSQKIYKILIFSKKNHFSPKCSTGHVECSFDNPAETFFTKCWKKFC